MRKILLSIFSVFAACYSALAQNDGVIITGFGENAQVRNPSAVLEAFSNDQGFLVPRLTLSERNAIVNPATSLLIYQTDGTPGYYYNGNTPGSPVWERLTVASGVLTGSGAATQVAFWSGPSTLSSNANLYWDNTNGRLGIANSSPSFPLDVSGKARIRRGGFNIDNANNGQLEVSNTGTGDAFISFHREGVFGAHFGLGADNWFSTIGWSSGATGYTSMRVGNSEAIGYVNTTVGYRVSNAAASGNYLRGNGTNFVSSAIQVGDLPAGSGSYIQNQAAADQAATFRINGNGLFNGGNVGIGTLAPGWKLDVNGNARIGANAGQNALAALAVSAGQGAATTFRDIDLHGSWSAGEGHAISASHAAGASNLVGQIVFEHNSPGSRIKFGRLYHSGDQTSYPMELVSNGANAVLQLNNDAYTLYGPNSTWGAYLQVGGNGRVTTGASVAATNGNLHIDAANGGYATYINNYSANETYINPNAGNIGLGTTGTFDKVTVNGRIRFGTNDVSYYNAGTGATFGAGDPTQGIGWGNQSLDEYGIFVAPQENLYGNYTRLILGWHTGVKIGASSSYGGTRFYNNSPQYGGTSATEIMSIGNGDNHVRVSNYLFAQYLNSSDNSVGSGITGVMVKAGDNYFRTGTAAGVLSFLGVTAPTGDNLGNHTATTTLNMNGQAITNSSNIYTSGWFRNTTANNGLYNEALGAHFYASAANVWNMGGGGTYPQLIFRDNHNSTIRGYVYSDVNGFGLLHNAGGWNYRSWNGGQEMYGTTYAGWSGLHANIMYDRDNTAYYTDPNGTSEMNLFTRGTLARSSLNALQNNSPVTTRSAQGDNYRNGSMGWGTVDMNTIYSNWGSGFIDSWSSPANGPGASSHYVGIQGMHHNYQDGTNAHGFQMVYAGGSNNRFFWRSGWPGPQAWVEMLHTGNATALYPNIGGDNLGNHSATTTLNMNANTIATAGDILSTNNYGQGLVGVYSDVRYQNVWAMGTSWRLPADGTTPGNLYGLAWTHSNIGGQSKPGLSHQLLIMENGATKVALGSGIWTSYNLQVGTYGGISSVPTTYGSIGLLNAKNGYYGILMGQGTANPNLMWDGGGNGGVYFENYGWMYYYLAGSRHLNINTSSDLGATLGVAGNIICTTIRSNGFIEPSDERLKSDISPILGAIDKVKQIQGVTYSWNKGLEQNKGLDEGKQYGVIAQELEKILPELVTTDENDENCWKAVNYSHLVPIVIEALKEQQSVIDRHEATINAQQQFIDGSRDDIRFLKEHAKTLEARINELSAEKHATGSR